MRHALLLYLLMASVGCLQHRPARPERMLRVQVLWKDDKIYPHAVGWSMTIYCGSVDRPGDPHPIAWKKSAERGDWLTTWPSACGDYAYVRLELEMSEKRGCPSPRIDAMTWDVKKPLVIRVPCEPTSDP